MSDWARSHGILGIHSKVMPDIAKHLFGRHLVDCFSIL